MNAWIGRERPTTFRDCGMAQCQELIQGGNFRPEILSQSSCGIPLNVALSEVKSQSRYRSDHKHHGRGKLCPKSGDLVFVGAASHNHGKSTCAVAPFFNSTGCSRVVLLSIQALSTYRPEGNLFNRYRPTASETTKWGVFRTRT